MGQQFLSQLRRGAPTIPDALLNTYLESISYRLAARSQLTDRRLSFVIIDSEEINAFAAPGGIIGVNTGLFLNAHSEAEFASVMGHEIAHVSQRHFARGVDEAQAGRVGHLASLLASVLVAVVFRWHGRGGPCQWWKFRRLSRSRWVMAAAAPGGSCASPANR